MFMPHTCGINGLYLIVRRCFFVAGILKHTLRNAYWYFKDMQMSHKLCLGPPKVMDSCALKTVISSGPPHLYREDITYRHF